MKNSIRWIGSLLCAMFVFVSFHAYADSASTTMSDSYITTKIKAKFAADKIVNPFNITVETNSGIVALSGTVRSVTEASRAVELAQETDGVKDVDASNLTLQDASQQPVTDSYITAKVKAMFMREKLFNTNLPVTAIKVETQNGVVFLSGTVDRQAQAKRAEEVAKSVDGVSKVVSTIEVGK